MEEIVDEILEEAKRLWNIGAAIHWLRPQSKLPAESGWTTGPRKTWKELETSYELGMNVGVRLGEASKIGENYLACIDVDIKDEKFRATALEALKSIVNQSLCPTVSSGARGGSRHIYVVTPKPFKMITAHKHPEWEICIYSEGRQMALPPSIHPTTGKKYQWVKERPIQTVESLPFYDFSGLQSVKTKAPAKKKETKKVESHEESFQFTITPVDLAWLPISDKIRAGIIHGTGVHDRSGYLLPATSALHAAGLSRDEILTVLTDADTFLGKCGYEHSHTNDRNVAAFWLFRYTVKRVLAERDGAQYFTPTTGQVAALPLNANEIAAQSEEFLAEIKSSRDNGYYTLGKRGALIPDFDTLLADFDEEHSFKTIVDMKTVYVWVGTHFVDYTPIEIRAFAEQSFFPRPLENNRQEFFSKVLANNTDKRSFFTESTEGKVNFSNGVLDLGSGTDDLISHTPEYGFRGVLPYEYDPFASARVFRRWITDVMQDDLELVAVLQEFMGYVVRGGDYRYHRALWLGGDGRNGKSTFVDLLKALIGAGNFSVLSIKALVNDKFAGATLDGKIANFSEETSPQELADSGPFKNLTGDGELFVQKKYGDPYSFRNRAKLIMTYNQIPDLKDLSPGMLSRPLIIPFTKVIAEHEQDRNIKKKLFAELPGIFNFALEGWKRLERQDGFTFAKRSSDALQKVKEESCGVHQWVQDHVEFDRPDAKTFKASELYTIYAKQDRYPYKAVEFYRRLHNHPEMRERWKRTNSQRIYQKVTIV